MDYVRSCPEGTCEDCGSTLCMCLDVCTRCGDGYLEHVRVPGRVNPRCEHGRFTFTLGHGVIPTAENVAKRMARR